jgi:hypothetical protein
VEGRKEVMRRWGKRCKQLVHVLKEKRRYWDWKH